MDRLIFLDFDDVLFYTRKFKDDYFKLFDSRGVSREVFEKFYYDSLDKRKTKNYSPIEHVKRINQEVKLDYQEFEESILEFISDTSGYIFGDAVDFIDNFPKEELHLISFSKTDFQKLKIFNSGIARYFRQIEIVDELKGRVIKEIIEKKANEDTKEIYFIDDRVEHLADAKKKNPQITTILFIRKEGRHKDRRNDCCDFMVKSPAEILKIINSKQKNGR